MLGVFIAHVACKRRLPILRRIAEPSTWPPLNIYVYPISALGSQEYTYLTENLKKTPIYQKDPKKADLFLIPTDISDVSSEQMMRIINRVASMGPWYDKYQGADHILIHTAFPSNKTTISPATFLSHPGHILTNGYELVGDYVKSWVYAKNVLIPPMTNMKQVNDTETKDILVSVDVSEENCLSQNVEIRRRIRKAAEGRKGVVLASTEAEMRNSMEKSKFSIVSACQTEISSQFFEAVIGLSVPIVVNDAMRFPFEDELVDYTGFVAQLSEENPDSAFDAVEKLLPHYDEMINEMRFYRDVLMMNPSGSGYVWGLSWSLYMKYLTWLPIRRTTLIEGVISESNVFRAG